MPDLGNRMGWGEILGPEAPYHDEHFCFGFTLLGKNTLYPAHYHPATELYVVLSGLAVWTLDGVSKVRGPGEFILHPSNHVHSMQTKDEPLLALYTWSGDDVVTLSKYV
jgi:mannose-6-phosphate isomerase-like protein (cupin superfamily)